MGQAVRGAARGTERTICAIGVGRRVLRAGALAAFALGVAAPGAFGAAGDLIQKPGTAGCVSELGAPCATGAALDGARSVAVSPDGTSAYVAAASGDAVAIFDRAPDGTLTQKAGAAGCIDDDGDPPCADGEALETALAVTVSPDGASVYVAAANGDAVAVFDRAPGGTLTQKAGAAGCIKESVAPAPCTGGLGLEGARSVTTSPDGSSVYVTGSNTLAIFDRAPNGTLTQKAVPNACFSETGTAPCTDAEVISIAQSVAVSPDGASVYVTGSLSDGIAIFDRAPNGVLTPKAGAAGCIRDNPIPPCADGEALGGANQVAVSADGTGVYVAAENSDAVAVFDRAPDGTLTQKAGAAGCIQEVPSPPCADGAGLDGAFGIALSADGTSAYAGSFEADAVAAFDRAADGTLAQKPGTAACVSETGSAPCATGTGLNGATVVAVAPDGTSAYVASVLNDGVAVFDRAGPDPPPPASCGQVSATIAGFAPSAPFGKRRKVPGVRALLSTSEGAVLSLQPSLIYRSGAGKARTATLPTRELTVATGGAVRIALPKKLRKRLPVGSRVTLVLSSSAKPVAPAGCAAQASQELRLKTRVKRIAPG